MKVVYECKSAYVRDKLQIDGGMKCRLFFLLYLKSFMPYCFYFSLLFPEGLEI